MNYSPILILNGEPNSIFLEIFFKVLKTKKINNPIILISSKKLIELQMRKLKFKKNIKVLEVSKMNKNKLNNKSINLIDVRYTPHKAYEKITKK